MAIRPTLRARRGAPSAGFTLIELLIVIAIIGTLAGMVVAGVAHVRGKTAVARVKSDIETTLVPSIKNFQFDMGYFPAFNKECDEDALDEFNAFPELYEALNGRRPPNGRGGKGSPYAEFKGEFLVVADSDDPSGFRKADNDEIEDPDVAKFYLDSWGQPYRYRENDSKKRSRPWMINPKSFDLWSTGVDGKNQACYGRDEAGDDIGNW